MNKENILELADQIENLKPSQFDMKSPEVGLFKRECGCIIAWGKKNLNINNVSVCVSNEQVREHLGITGDQFFEIKYPEDEPHGTYNPYDATKEQAAKLLRNLAETGEVDWEKALEE